MRRVLIVCYDYPAISAAGVIRTYQIVKSLPNYGWQPVILTAQQCVDGEDNIETSDGALQCAKFTAQAPGFLAAFQSNHPGPLHALRQSARAANGRWRRLGRFASNLAVPDGKIGWIYQAVKRGLEIAQSHPIRMCFSVSPRPTAHIVGYRLAAHLNVPWVADFALPWSDAPWLAGRARIANWLDYRLERMIARSARHLTVAYRDLARSISTRYGRTPADISVIPTGFNEDLFVNRRSPASRKLTIIYPGNHFCEKDRYGEAFLNAIDEWINSEPSVEDNLDFVFVGKTDEDLVRHRATMAHPQVVRLETLVSHRACVQAILSSHLCVVNTVGNRIPAKVYECMRAGKWILALTTPGSDLAGIVNGYRNGIVVAARNTAAIRQALQNIWRRYRAGTLESMPSDEALTRYSSRHGAALVAAIFDRLSRNYEPAKQHIQAI